MLSPQVGATHLTLADLHEVTLHWRGGGGVRHTGLGEDVLPRKWWLQGSQLSPLPWLNQGPVTLPTLPSDVVTNLMVRQLSSLSGHQGHFALAQALGECSSLHSTSLPGMPQLRNPLEASNQDCFFFLSPSY